MIENEYFEGRIIGVKLNVRELATTHAMYPHDLMLLSRAKFGLVFSKLVQPNKKRRLNLEIQIILLFFFFKKMLNTLGLH